MIGAAGLAIPVTLPMPLQLKTRFRDDYQVEAGGEQVRIFFELRTSCAASSCLKSGVLGKSPWPNGRGGKLLKFPFHGNAHERALILYHLGNGSTVFVIALGTTVFYIDVASHFRFDFIEHHYDAFGRAS
jgi:hypothetical protein